MGAVMSTVRTPHISVIMGIYNCAETLPEALDSLLAQTLQDFEVILCDDGSTDDTYQVATQYQKAHPEKFVLLKNQKNEGLNHTLNVCLKAAKGKYIARMDGDDRCRPDRFEEELKALADDPSIAIVSSDMCHFDETGTWGMISHPTDPEPKDFLHGTPFCHAPCMVRKEAYDAVDGYTEDKRLLRVEDYNLWMKMYQKGFRGRNIHEPLYEMRDDRNAYNRRKFKYRLNEAHAIHLAVRELKLPVYGHLYALRPILVGLLPRKLYDSLHKKKLQKEA